MTDDRTQPVGSAYGAPPGPPAPPTSWWARVRAWPRPVKALAGANIAALLALLVATLAGGRGETRLATNAGITTTAPTTTEVPTTDTSDVPTTDTSQAPTTTAPTTTTLPPTTTTVPPTTTTQPPAGTCAASVSMADPAGGDRQVISLTSNLPSTPVAVTVHEQPSRTLGAQTDGNGSTSVSYRVGNNTTGRVNVDVNVGNGRAFCATSYTVS